MKYPVANAVLAIFVIGAGAIAGSVAADKGFTALHVSTLTADVSNCQTDIMSDAYLTGGPRTQAAATAEVAACKVVKGTKLVVSVAPGGQDYTITGTSTDAPGYRVSLNSAAGETTIKVIPPTA